MNWRTKTGCVIIFLGGVVAVLKGAIAEPLDPNAIYVGIMTAGGAFAGWGSVKKVERWMRSKGL